MINHHFIILYLYFPLQFNYVIIIKSMIIIQLKLKVEDHHFYFLLQFNYIIIQFMIIIHLKLKVEDHLKKYLIFIIHFYFKTGLYQLDYKCNLDNNLLIKVYLNNHQLVFYCYRNINYLNIIF